MIKISDTEYFSNDRTIRFLNMDCNVFMAGCKENEFDLNLSDPPYGIGEKFKGGKNSKMKNFNAIVEKKWDEVPSKKCINEIFRTSKNQIIWGGNYFELPPTRCFIVWDKMISEDFSLAMAELAWTSFDKLAKIKKLFNEREGRIHETQKPIELYKWVLDNYTKPTDTILDCFGGSMSNAIACHMERRKLTIIELDVDYFKSALKRFETYERQMTLFSF